MKRILTDTAIVAIGLAGLFYGDHVFGAIMAAGIWLLFEQPFSWASESPVRLMIVHGAWLAFWGGLFALMYWIDQQSQPKAPDAN